MLARKVGRVKENQDSAIAWELRREMRVSTRYWEMVKSMTTDFTIRLLMAFKRAVSE